MRGLMVGMMLVAGAAGAEDALPKLGPNAVPITADAGYVRSEAAPDYWAFGPFVKPQFTTSACSIATVTALVNGLKGLPELGEETVTTQPQMLELVGSEEWAALSAEGGDGVTWEQFTGFTRAALDASGMEAYGIEAFHPEGKTDETMASLRRILTENEASQADAVMIYFNQGVLTGDWDGPHISLIGAYDAGTDRVLILEVDQEWYVPYWSPVEAVMEAILKPAPAEQGVLEGQTGGLVRVYPMG